MHGRKESNLQLRVLEARALTDGASAVWSAAFDDERKTDLTNRADGGDRTRACQFGRLMPFPLGDTRMCGRGEDRTHHAPVGAAGLRPAGPPLVRLVRDLKTEEAGELSPPGLAKIPRGAIVQEEGSTRLEQRP